MITSWVLANLLEQVLSSDCFENILLGCLLDFTSYQELIKHEVGFLKVEDDIQLTHLKTFSQSHSGLKKRTYTPKVLVQQLDVAMNDLKSNQLVVRSLWVV